MLIENGHMCRQRHGQPGIPSGKVLWPPRDDKILVQMVLFSFVLCVIILLDILLMRSALIAGRKWQYVLRASWLTYCGHSRGEFLRRPRTCNDHILMQVMLFSFSLCTFLN